VFGRAGVASADLVPASVLGEILRFAQNDGVNGALPPGTINEIVF